jgi:hypothetical protein
MVALVISNNLAGVLPVKGSVVGIPTCEIMIIYLTP